MAGDIAVSQFFTASECKLVDNHVTSLIVFMVPGVNNFKPGHISVLHASNTLVSMKAENLVEYISVMVSTSMCNTVSQQLPTN